MKTIAKILIVEDREPVRNTIKEMLSGLSYRIKEAESGEEALKELVKVAYDVIILDIKLPGINGIEVMRRARQVREVLPQLIVLTDHKRFSVEASKLEAFSFVPKTDLDPDTFKEIVVAAVNKSQECNHVRVKNCFLHNQFGCSISFDVRQNLVFVGIPFRMKRAYEEGIKPLFKDSDLVARRADEVRKTGDFSCKICGMIQACKLAIFDISTLSPNVLIELGFAYASGKDVIILKNRKTKMPSDLMALEPVEYSNISELRRKLRLHAKQFRQKSSGS